MYLDNWHGDNNADMVANGELRFLEQTLQGTGPETVVFDVGANTGQWCRAVVTINQFARVFCFEPSRRAREKFHLKNFPPNVVCNAIGLGSRPGRVKLYVNPNALELSSVYGCSSSPGLEIEEVAVETIDNYCRNHKIRKIDFLKIDVEGHEFEVLKGAREMLSEGRIRIVQFEYGQWYIYAGVFLFNIFEWIRGLPYEVWKVMPKEMLKIEHYSPELERLENAYYVLKLREDGPGQPVETAS